MRKGVCFEASPHWAAYRQDLYALERLEPLSSDVRARFVSQCLESAKARLTTVVDAMADGSKAAVVRFELHSLAGEAAVVGLKDLAKLAREGEAEARTWVATGDSGAQLACARKIRALRRVVDQMANSHANTTNSSAVQSSGRPILIVDDSMIIGASLCNAFQTRGLRATHVVSQQAALTLLRESGASIVVVDINMPGAVSVATFVGEVVAAQRNSPPPVVVMSGMDEAAIYQASAGANVTAVSKAGGLDPIVQVVQAAMGRG